MMLVVLTGCAGVSEATLGPPNRPAAFQRNDNATNPSRAARLKIQKESHQDNLRTFGYSSRASSRFAIDIVVVGSALDQFYTHIAAGDYDAVRADTKKLLRQAEQLRIESSSTARRLRGLRPAHRGLDRTRKVALSVFAQTADYARAIMSVVKPARSATGDLGLMLSPVAALQASGDGLALSYGELTTRLHGWTTMNPRAAARARAKYGT
jgi:hypothetical protein